MVPTGAIIKRRVKVNGYATTSPGAAERFFSE